MKLKNSNCDETQNHKWWHNSKTQTVTKLKIKIVTTQKLKLWQNSNWKKKTQKLKMSQNSNCEKNQKIKLDTRTQKHKLWQNSNCGKTQKLKLCWKLNFWSNCDEFKNSNWDETQKLKWWQNSNSDCDKTQKLKLWQNSYFGKTPKVTKLKM